MPSPAGEFTGGAAGSMASRPSFDECLRQTMSVFFGDRMEQEPIDGFAVRVAEHLERGDALVLLDNFETVAHNTDLIRWLAAFLPGADSDHNQRNPARIAGQRDSLSRSCAEGSPRSLFIGARHACGAAIAGRESEIDRICAAVGCQPLAIELLASRCASIPLNRLLERVLRSPAVIDAKDDPTRPYRHRSADHVHRALIQGFEHEKPTDLLRRLSIFPDGAARRSSPPSWPRKTGTNAAEELVAASVWRLSGRRYTMHPLVRQVALEHTQEHRGVLGASRCPGGDTIHLPASFAVTGPPGTNGRSEGGHRLGRGRAAQP